MYIYHFNTFDYFCFHQYYLSAYASRNDYKDFLPSSIKESINMKPIETLVAIDELRQMDITNHVFVVDLRKMKKGGIHDISIVRYIITNSKYESIILLVDDIELNELAEDIAKHNRKYSYFKTDNSTYSVLSTDPENKELNTIFKDIDIQTCIDRTINNYIFDNIVEKTKNVRELKSSNVYVDRYFDAKNAFYESALFNLITYRMILMIESILPFFDNSTSSDNHKKADFDAFICGSINGACLASALSVFYQKPVKHLKNIGPDMNANDEKMLDKLHKGERYIYIYDFICWGTEYDRIKMICKLKKCSIICSAGISYFRLPHLELADIPDSNGSPFTFDPFTVSKEKAQPRAENTGLPVTQENPIKPKKPEYIFYELNSSLKICALFQINRFKNNFYKFSIDKRHLNKKRKLILKSKLTDKNA